MTMTPDELRALADALDEAMFKLRTYKRTDEAAKACERAADYLLACADAQPVAYQQWDDDKGYWYYGDASCAEKDDELLYTHPAPAAPQAASGEGRVYMPVETGGASVSPTAYYPVELAPAAPQADIGRLRECAQRLVDGARWGLAGALSPSSKAREIPSSAWSDVKSRHLASLRDALAAPQAEPKREPLSDDEIGKLAWKQNLWTDHMIEFSFLAFAREVERAHGIGGSDD